MGGGAEVAVVVEDAAAGSPRPDEAAAAAGAGEEGMRMEGWLYLIRSNRFGMQYSRKRYFVLEDAALRCFKSAPSSKREVIITAAPGRGGIVCSCCLFVFLTFCGGVVGSFLAPVGVRAFDSPAPFGRGTRRCSVGSEFGRRSPPPSSSW